MRAEEIGDRRDDEGRRVGDESRGGEERRGEEEIMKVTLDEKEEEGTKGE